MKTNHNRSFVGRSERDKSLDLCKGGLKAEGNRIRRGIDREAIRAILTGQEIDTFAPSRTGNPWRWD